MRTSWRRAWDMQRILHFRVARLIFNRLHSTGCPSLSRACAHLHGHFMNQRISCADWEGGSQCVSNVFDTAPIQHKAGCIFIYDRAPWCTSFNSAQKPRTISRAHVTRTIPFIGAKKRQHPIARGLSNSDSVALILSIRFRLWPPWLRWTGILIANTLPVKFYFKCIESI